MPRPRPEPVQVVKERREKALNRMVDCVPYIRHLGISFERRGDELTAILAYADRLIGNPMLPALHGGAVGAFLEIAAVVELEWSMVWDKMESGPEGAAAIDAGRFPPMPRTIDFTIDYLRSGLPRDAYARARINRSGRRYASVHVEAWQDNRARLFAQATGHFLMPPPDER
ncbi:PaaI family thioesterase [Rhodobacteraceae bacterium 2CG4]|uniref:PaaI family thioesterase n=1 Tax=Halovulum marinum TaxID=2662447 RepID=A0A6L5Z3D1_9RHOB|nr:PaaI family thioesterase [Halovulum marinum]MSU91083.1 PaaI family thioesterase [Halovulum marinum]